MKIKKDMDLTDIMQMMIDEIRKQKWEQKRQKKETARLRGEVRRLRQELLNRDVRISLPECDANNLIVENDHLRHARRRP